MKKFLILLVTGTAFALASCSSTKTCCGSCAGGACSAEAGCEAGCTKCKAAE